MVNHAYSAITMGGTSVDLSAPTATLASSVMALMPCGTATSSPANLNLLTHRGIHYTPSLSCIKVVFISIHPPLCPPFSQPNTVSSLSHSPPTTTTCIWFHQSFITGSHQSLSHLSHSPHSATGEQSTPLPQPSHPHSVPHLQGSHSPFLFLSLTLIWFTTPPQPLVLSHSHLSLHNLTHHSQPHHRLPILLPQEAHSVAPLVL